MVRDKHVLQGVVEVFELVDEVDQGRWTQETFLFNCIMY